jgi:hypothetical protein
LSVSRSFTPVKSRCLEAPIDFVGYPTDPLLH